MHVNWWTGGSDPRGVLTQKGAKPNANYYAIDFTSKNLNNRMEFIFKLIVEKNLKKTVSISNWIVRYKYNFMIKKFQSVKSYTDTVSCKILV